MPTFQKYFDHHSENFSTWKCQIDSCDTYGMSCDDSVCTECNAPRGATTLATCHSCQDTTYDNDTCDTCDCPFDAPAITPQGNNDITPWQCEDSHKNTAYKNYDVLIQKIIDC